MKRLLKFKKYVINWLLIRLTSNQYSLNEIEKINNFKYGFQFFFNGGNSWNEPVINIRNFGITSLNFRFTGNSMEVEIALMHAGILIGKRGEQIERLNKCLNKYCDCEVVLKLTDSKLWKKVK